MFKALGSTITELADSKKFAYAFTASLVLGVLIVALHVDPTTAGVIVGPLMIGLLGQAHVDASIAKGGAGSMSGANIGQVIEAQKPAIDPTGAP